MQKVLTNNHLLSTVNSTVISLGANEVFTGEAQPVIGYTQLILSYVTDSPSAVNGISIEFSPDGVVWSTKFKHTAYYNWFRRKYTENKTYIIHDKYFRIVYTNGSSSQSFFQLQTSFQIILNQESIKTRLGSEYKRDVAMGLITSTTNHIVKGTLDDGVGENEVILTKNFTWPQVARKVRIKAGGSVNDTSTGSGARSLTVFGLNENWEEINETLDTNGSQESNWTTNLFFRVNNVTVLSVGTYSGSNDGDITIENETELIDLSTIYAGYSRSHQCNYTVPKTFNCTIPEILFSCDKDSSATVNIWYRKNSEDLTEPYQPKSIFYSLKGFSGIFQYTPEEITSFPEMTDFWITAKKDTGTGNATVSVNYGMNLSLNSNN
jgi:hypothetical protein